MNPILVFIIAWEYTALFGHVLYIVCGWMRSDLVTIGRWLR